MKGLFPEFEPKVQSDFKEIWSDARFCFDANILLNLYRYRPDTRDQLLEILRKLQKQVWIPHHAALEFQRNRLNVIADQSRRFSEVRAAVEKSLEGLKTELDKLQLDRRHSLIDASPIVESFGKSVEDFLRQLSEAEKNQTKITDVDPLKEDIEGIFSDRIGEPPKDQKAVDELYREAEFRHARRIPPGYMDADKGKDVPDEHVYGGIIYKRKYGDFIIWRQILTAAQKDDVKRLIFVTDDAKEDWWWIVRSDGPKTLGPRPELVDEARRQGGLDYFHMYNPESFLYFANAYLKAEVSTEAINEVRDVSKDRQLEIRDRADYSRLAWRAENAFEKWLALRFDTVERIPDGFPHFVATKRTRRFGFEVKVFRRMTSLVNRIEEMSYRGRYLISEGRLDLFTIVWIVENGDAIDNEQLERLRGRLFKSPDKVRVLIGRLSESSTGDSFTPLKDFGIGDDRPIVDFGQEV